MAVLDLRLLGGFDSRLGKGQTVAFPTRKAQALVAVLALRPGQWHTRERLISLLWADNGTQQARQSLRQTLVRIRRALPDTRLPWFLTEGGAVALNPAVVDVDVATFERLMADPSRQALETSITVYRGDLLDGFAVDEAGFEEWVLAERERLRERAIQAFSRLLRSQSAEGPGEAAIQTGLRLLALDALQEPVHRALMQLYARQGRRSAALRQYQNCVAVLQRELGVEPEGETKALYQDILRQAPAAPRPVARPSAAPARPPAAPPEPDTPLIGRAAQFGRLREALEDAWKGRSRVALVPGEAGIGKSRLTEELAAAALASGGRVLVGRSHESEQILPFRPWIAALRGGHVLAERDVMDALSPAWRRELSRLFPEVGEAMPDALAAAESHLRLFEGLSELIGGLAVERPLLLVIEDLQWADDLSTRLLPFMVRHVAGRPVLLVATVREEELATLPRLRAALDELERGGQLIQVALPPLSASETRTLVRALARAGSQESQVATLGDHVWRLSEGNPFVIVETMRALVEGRAPGDADALSLPQRVRALIGARLERVSDRARRVVEMAAVVPGGFSFALLLRASGLDEREAAEAVEELVRRRLLVAAGERFELAHDRIRTVVYEGLLAPRRRALHAAVGAGLEVLEADHLEDVADRLAFHHARADDADRAITYLALFADATRRRYAFDDALRALDQAWTHLPRLPAAERDRRLVELAVRKAWVLSMLGRFREILALLLPLEETAERLADPELVGPYRFRLALTYGYLGQSDSGVHAARAAIAAAAACGDAVTLGQAHYAVALIQYWVGDLVEAVVHAREAIAALGRTPRREWFGLAWWMLGAVLHLRGAFDEALRAFGTAAEIGDAVGDARLQSLTAFSAGWLHVSRGDSAAGIEACQWSLETSRDPVTTAGATSVMGLAWLEQGDLPRGLATLDEALDQFARLGMRHSTARFMAILAEAHLAAGAADKARDLAGRALANNRETGSRWGAAHAQRVLGLVARVEGAAAQAQEYLAAALHDFVAMGAAFDAARCRLDLAESLAAEDPGRAAAMATEARAALGDLGALHYVERAQRLAVRLQPSPPKAGRGRIGRPRQP